MKSTRPLADLLRPQSLDEIVGQEHLVGQGGIIRKFLAQGFLPSLIFWGPPGSGKTTLAYLLASLTHAYFVPTSAVTVGLPEVRRVIKEAHERLKIYGQRTVLFLDEIHRFNKAQQDALLPHVEKGTIILVGATTENPSFEVISPLLSRCRVLVVNPLSEAHLQQIAKRALNFLKLELDPEAEKFLLEIANGDARSLLTILEIARELKPRAKRLSARDIEEASQRKMLQYDLQGEEHYNTISAFIKSMRASDIDAALYYLARMIAAGENPLFIARRLVIFASEDIGVAQPTALVVANSVFEACHKVGLPEAQINLAHGVVYLCLAKKDRSAYNAYFAAVADVEKYGNLPIPLKIRNAPTRLMKNLGYGRGYERYTQESLLPDKIKGKKYYKPQQSERR